MKKELAVLIAVISALIGVALLSGLEAAAGMLDGDGGTIIPFINAVIGYFGGRALYKKLLNRNGEGAKEETEEDTTSNQAEVVNSEQSQQTGPAIHKYDNSALGEIIAECNIPESMIPRVIGLYMKDPKLLSSLHGGFSAEQLGEILTGLENGQDVSFFMNENLSAEQMRAIRENLPSSSK